MSNKNSLLTSNEIYVRNLEEIIKLQEETIKKLNAYYMQKKFEISASDLTIIHSINGKVSALKSLNEEVNSIYKKENKENE